MAEPSVLDPPTVHHEFAGHGHGRKLALKEIDEDSELYGFMIETEAEVIRELYDPLPDVLIGMANSANRIARDVAPLLGDQVVVLETEKNRLGHVIPTYAARVALRNSIDPEFLLVIEDVGTTGKTVAKFAEKLSFWYTIPRLEAMFTWQRQPDLPVLDKRGIPYQAVINSPLKTYKDAKACRQDPDGYCANGVELIHRKKK